MSILNNCLLINQENSEDISSKTINGRPLHITCKFCHRRIKEAPLIGTHRQGIDFMELDLNEPILYFCDFICAKLYDTNVHLLSIDLKDYRKKYLNKKLNKISTIIYGQVIDKLFTQLPVKICNPTNSEEFKKVRNEYMKIL